MADSHLNNSTQHSVTQVDAARACAVKAWCKLLKPRLCPDTLLYTAAISSASSARTSKPQVQAAVCTQTICTAQRYLACFQGHETKKPGKLASAAGQRATMLFTHGYIVRARSQSCTLCWARSGLERFARWHETQIQAAACIISMCMPC